MGYFLKTRIPRIWKECIWPIFFPGILWLMVYIIILAVSEDGNMFSWWEKIIFAFFFAGVPTGLRKMFVIFVPTGSSSVSSTVGIFALDILLGGLVGGFILGFRVIKSFLLFIYILFVGNAMIENEY